MKPKFLAAVFGNGLFKHDYFTAICSYIFIKKGKNLLFFAIFGMFERYCM
jgi:hypothetical protein